MKADKERLINIINQLIVVNDTYYMESKKEQDASHWKDLQYFWNKLTEILKEENKDNSEIVKEEK